MDNRLRTAALGHYGHMDARAALRQWLQVNFDELEIPGAAVGVEHDGHAVTVCLGVADRISGRPVTSDTLFQIASATKPFTATAVLRLHERGMLDIDAPVRTYLPDLRLGDSFATETVTARHLLTHTGGFEGDDSPLHDWGHDALDRSLVELEALPQVFEPGRVMSYSNAGFRLLGLLAQRVSSQPYEELVRETVLEPVGMSASRFLPWEVIGRDVALGHGGSKPWAYDLWRPELPEGGLLSTITDMMAWARFQLFGTTVAGTLLSSDLRLTAHRPAVAAPPPLTAVGLPWLLSERNGARIVSHGGNIANVTVSSFDLVPEHGLAVCVLANARGGKQLGERLLGWCLENLAGLMPTPAPSVRSLTDDEAAAYVGSYDLGLGTFVVHQEGTGLRIDIRPNTEIGKHDEFPPVHVVAIGGDTFGAASDPARMTCSFQRDQSGVPALLFMMGRAALRSV